MEECIYCGVAVAWDKVDDPFWGFDRRRRDGECPDAV
jgi:hypothetical protein